jgi:hypothetical protein
MRHLTDREKKLMDEYDSKGCSEERKKEISKELQEIDKKERGPFS